MGVEDEVDYYYEAGSLMSFNRVSSGYVELSLSLLLARALKHWELLILPHLQ